MDVTAFGTARDGVKSSIRCLTGIVDPQDAAALHRVDAFAAYIAQDKDTAVASFRASLATAPSWELSEEVAPEGHDLRTWYGEARSAPPAETTAILPPAGAVVYVDGLQATMRPYDRPIVLQVMDTESARITWSGWLAAGAPMPQLQGLARTEIGDDTPSRRGASGVLIGGAVGAAVASGVLGGVALYTRSQFESTDELDDLEPLQGRTNTFGYAAQGTLGVAVGLGVIGIIAK
jgi:hypothetical protein